MRMKLVFGSLMLIALAVLGAGIFRNTLASSTEISAEMQSNEDIPNNILEPFVEVDNWKEDTAEEINQIDQANSDKEPVDVIGELSEAEKEGLLFMYEEEKLARDVYRKMFDSWELPIYQNIAGSEQTHMNAISGLIARYKLTYVDLSQSGTFSNPELQKLYDEMIVRGDQSMEEALLVSAAIEEIDILDLQEHLAESKNLEIQNVYNNLLRGSQNHLAAFTRMLLNKTKQTYQPQFMSQEEYLAVTSQSNQGKGNGRGGNRGQGGKWSRRGSQ